MQEPKQQIAMHCGTPLVPTIMFPQAEFYCGQCGTYIGALDAQGLESTAELKQQAKRNKKAFDKIAVACIPPRSYVVDCPECADGQFHTLHAHSVDIEKSNRAYEKLMRGGII